MMERTDARARRLGKRQDDSPAAHALQGCTVVPPCAGTWGVQGAGDRSPSRPPSAASVRDRPPKRMEGDRTHQVCRAQRPICREPLRLFTRH